MLTKNTRKAILDNIVGIASTPIPQGLYLALSTTTPTEAGGNFTEPQDSNYARVYIGTTSQAGPNFPFEWKDTDYNQVWNKYEIHFNTATANWGNVTHIGIFDAATGGNLIAYTELAVPVNVQSGHIPTIISHAATISIDLDILNTDF